MALNALNGKTEKVATVNNFTNILFSNFSSWNINLLGYVRYEVNLDLFKFVFPCYNGKQIDSYAAQHLFKVHKDTFSSIFLLIDERI